MTVYKKSGTNSGKIPKGKVASGKANATGPEHSPQTSSTETDQEPSQVNERLNYFLAIRSKSTTQYANATENLINLVRSGITKSAYDRILAESGLLPQELAAILRISERTLRRYTPKQTFPAEQSERLVELASLYSRGEEVFESLERFKEWMSHPQIAFGNKQPTALLDTSMGIGMIQDELGRIEQGVFA